MEHGMITIIDNIHGTNRKVPASQVTYETELAELVKSHGKNIFGVAHMADLDGVGSAALLMHYFRMPSKNAAFANYDKEHFLKAADEIKAFDPKNAVVVFCDMGVDPHMAETIREFLDYLKTKGNLLLWFDHHPWEDSVIESLAKHLDYLVAGENPIFCGSEILYLTLCKKDEFGGALTQKIHLSDFKPVDTPEYIALEKVRFSIGYFLWKSKTPQKKLRLLARWISKGSFDNAFIQKANDAGARLSQKNLQRMLSSSALVDVRYKIAVGFGDHIDTNAACRALIAKHDADIGLFVKKDSVTGSMRSKDDTVDCSALARAFGGNGHPQAAGFPLDKAAFGPMGSKERKEILGLIKEKAVWTYQK